MIPRNDVPVRMAERPKATSWGNDDTTLTGCAFENVNIRPTNQLFVPGGAQITAARSQARDDVWSDVLV